MKGLFEQITYNHAPGKYFEPFSPNIDGEIPISVRLIAYYLPQFHRIDENDEWWGRGFSEWSNVTKSIPKFSGHYQPHLPIHFGFYDLSNEDVLREQAVVARGYGIHGFCLHHYWFSGKQLLETPLKILLRHRDIDLPFCLNWANENWTRRWDGQDESVLMAQRYAAEDDLAFIRSLEPAISDSRYITVDSRPLIMVYRPSLLPDPKRTVDLWRNHFVRAGYKNPYLVMPQGWRQSDPTEYGLDAAAGFPPHLPRSLTQHSESLDLRATDLFDPSFKGRIVDYWEFASLAASYRADGFPYFPGVFPSWDNDARRSGRGLTFINSTPQKYGRWLREACRTASKAEQADERIVFINAWNEWGEGAHLEPDRHFGFAYLAETRRSLAAEMLVDHGADSITDNDEVATKKKRKLRLGLGLRSGSIKALEAVADMLR